VLPADFTQRIQAAPARHGNVQENDVPRLLFNAPQYLLRILGFADREHARVMGQDLLESFADQRMIIGD
jgi:hypothetical protein